MASWDAEPWTGGSILDLVFRTCRFESLVIEYMRWIMLEEYLWHRSSHNPRHCDTFVQASLRSLTAGPTNGPQPQPLSLSIRLGVLATRPVNLPLSFFCPPPTEQPKDACMREILDADLETPT